MLNKIIIKNFQSHKLTEIKLGQLTVIHGLSDSGKSAIRKAIQCVVYKTPFYIRVSNDVEDGFIRLEFDDYVIERYVKLKNKRGNKNKIEFSKDVYIINNKDEYERFGVTLPENIENELKFLVHKFDSKQVTYNIMSQFDDMFFIGKSYDSIRNKMINLLVPDCDIVNDTIQEFKDEKNENLSGIRTYKKLVTEIDEKLEKINNDDIELVKDTTVKLLKYKSAMELKQNKRNELIKINEQLRNLNLVNVDLTKFETILKNYKLNINKCNEMRNKLNVLKDINITISKQELNKHDFDYDYEIENIKILKDTITKHKNKLSELRGIGVNLNEIEANVKILDNDIKNVTNDIKTLKTQYQNENKKVICPLTGKVCMSVNENKA